MASRARPAAIAIVAYASAELVRLAWTCEHSLLSLGPGQVRILETCVSHEVSPAERWGIYRPPEGLRLLP